MRFLVLSQYYAPEIGAPQALLSNLVRELSSAGHEVEVVTAFPNYPTGKILPGYKNRLYKRDEVDGVRVNRSWVLPAVGSGKKRLLSYFSFTASSMVGLLRARRPDYVLVLSPPLFLSLPARIVTRLWGIPFIFIVADLWPDSVRDLGVLKDGLILRTSERFERWTYRRATYLTAVTEGIREALTQRKGVPASKVLFMPNGVDTTLFRPQPPDDEYRRKLGLNGDRVIVYAGNHGYTHGMEVAVRAAKLLEGEGVKFVFVGDGSDKPRIVALAGELKATDTLFLDPVPPGDVAKLYAIATAGLATLRQIPISEGTRLVKMYPVMASGKPVLYSGPGEGARLVEEARAGIATAPEDPDQLAAAVRTLVRDDKLAGEMGADGRLFVEQNLSWPILVRDWLRQLEERRVDGTIVKPAWRTVDAAPGKGTESASAD